MTTAEVIQSAADHHNAIKANVDNWYSDAIDHATFSANQRRLWDEAHAKGRDWEGVLLAVMRGDEADALAYAAKVAR